MGSGLNMMKYLLFENVRCYLEIPLLIHLYSRCISLHHDGIPGLFPIGKCQLCGACPH